MYKKLMMTMKDKIKEKALEEHIPIIMDDTLEILKKALKDSNLI